MSLRRWAYVPLMLMGVINAPAQFQQQGPKLVGTAAGTFARQGSAAALSADGNTALIGGDGDNSGTGAAWVYTRSAGVWVQQAKLVGTGGVSGPSQGNAVALSADGNTALVGGIQDNSGMGAVWVFTRSGTSWSQQGPKLVGTGVVGTTNIYQGFSVGLSADGNTAIVGGVNDNHSTGAAWVYTRSSGIWTQQGTKLVGTGVVGNASGQGSSVSLSADGNTALIGGWLDNFDIGAAWIFTRSGSVWTQQGPKLVGSGIVGFPGVINPPIFQGFSGALSADGNTAIVGGDFDNDNPLNNTSVGAAWIFTRNNGVWSQQGPKLVGTGGANAAQGFSVAISGDGNLALVGGPSDSGNTGTVWVYNRIGGVWTQQGSKLIGSGAVGSAQQGISAALSADGSTALVGGFGDNGFDGASWVFVVPDLLTKSFSPAQVPVGSATALTFTVHNMRATPLTGAAFTDTLPCSLIVATPNGVAGSCGGGAITAVAGSGTVSLTGGSIPAFGSCTFKVNLLSTVPGVCTNTTSGLFTNQYAPSPSANACVAVGLLPSQLSMSFSGFLFNWTTHTFLDSLTISNVSSPPQSFGGPYIYVVFTSLTPGVTLVNPTGYDVAGNPYLAIPVPGGLIPGQSITVPLEFSDPPPMPLINFIPTVYGQQPCV